MSGTGFRWVKMRMRTPREGVACLKQTKVKSHSVDSAMDCTELTVPLAWGQCEPGALSSPTIHIQDWLTK